MKKFEYLVLDNNCWLCGNELNKLGAAGWELVTFIDSYHFPGTRFDYIFKREVLIAH